MKVSVIYAGGGNVKVLATGWNERRGSVSGSSLAPKRFVTKVRKITADWTYDAVSIGYPVPVLRNQTASEPRKPHKKAPFEGHVGQRGLDRLGKRRWWKHVSDVVARFIAALEPEDFILGGGHMKHVEPLLLTYRVGANACLGGFRLWDTCPRLTNKPIAPVRKVGGA